MNIGLFPEGVDLPAAVIAVARMGGCNCDPDVSLAAGVASVMHDNWCRLLTRLERRN